jgi:hypothetical protein
VNSEPSEADTRICPGLSGRSEATIRSVPTALSVNAVLQLAWARVEDANRQVDATAEAAVTVNQHRPRWPYRL